MTRLLLTILLFPSIAFSAQLDLSKDANGWTVFTPSADTDVVYVDSVTGNDTTCQSYRTSAPEMGADPFNPAGVVLPCATVAKALTFTANNQPDWILIKRGSEFTDTLRNKARIGRSPTEPFVLAAYGSSGPSPLFNVPGNSVSALGISWTGDIYYVAISGMDMYAYTRDPENASYAAGSTCSGMSFYAGTGNDISGVLVEGCRFRYFQQSTIQAAPSGVNTGLTLRRNVFSYSYPGGTAHSQGLYMFSATDVLIEENVFDHNGWLTQNNSNGTEEALEATPYNHGLYLSRLNDLVLRKNIISRSSSFGIKLDNDDLPAMQNAVVDNNLIIGGEAAIGVMDGDTDTAYRAYNTTVTNNVFSNIGLSNPVNRELAWGFYTRDLDVAVFRNNIMTNQSDEANSCKFFEIWGDSRGVVFENNKLANSKNCLGLYLRAGGPKDVTIRNNDIQSPVGAGDLVRAGDGANPIDAELVGYVIAGNRYWTDADANNRFFINDSAISDSEWFSSINDTSTIELAAYPDQARDVDTYMGKIGQTATVDAFIAAVVAQDRFNWNQRLSAAAVNNYIRAGFGTTIGGARHFGFAGSGGQVFGPAN